MLKKGMIVTILLFPFPWGVRRKVLNKVFGYEINGSAFISRFAIVIPDKLILAKGSRIAAFNIVIHLHKLQLGESASIGRSNWISGLAKKSKKHFLHVENRDPSLIMDRGSAITKKHIIDCTHQILIGKFSTIAGYQSQFLTHSIDYENSRQDCSPIVIGDFCLVGTRCVFLPGSSLPSFSICGAGTVMNKAFSEEYSLYAGVPAMRKKELDARAKYFIRDSRYVD